MHVMRHFIILLSAVVTLSCLRFCPPPLSAAPAAKPGTAAKHINAQEADKLLKENKSVVVLDIRTPEEYAGGHIAGAKNIDFLDNDFEKSLKGLDKSKAYLVHCASGGRSSQSLEQFQALGFKSVYHLDGGFNSWKKAGKPVAK